MKLVIDCFGGDKGCVPCIEAAKRALAVYPDLSFVLVGDEEKIRAELPEVPERIEILHAPDVVTGNDKPTDAIRLKRESSMMKAIKLLREDESADGMISTGPTGVLIAAATLRIGRIEGVRRPAFCPILPTMKGGIVGICDSGANVECTPEMLFQFAVMGSEYLKAAFGIKEPRVALLNVGTEEEKGDDLHREAHKLLKGVDGIHFVGNMESRDLLSGNYDLVVCDGFSGNVLVKTTEGTALELLKKIKKDIYSRGIYKLGALFMKKMFEEEKRFMNYQNYGGSVLLGTEKIIIKGHGSSDEAAVYKCIEQARAMSGSNLNEKIKEQLESEASEHV